MPSTIPPIWQQNNPGLPQLPGLPGLAPPPRRRRRRAAPLPTLTEEEEKGLLGHALGGLAYVAGAIDKPFAATRGSVNWALGGEAGGGLKHLIPFSGSLLRNTPLGVDPEEKIWGRDVLTTAGISPPNKPGFEDWGWDLAGFGADLLIAPPLPIGPAGSLTAKGLALARGGKAAARALKGVKGPAAIGAAKEATEGVKIAAKAFRPGATTKDVAAAIEQGGYIAGLSPAAYANEIRLGLRGTGGLGLPFPLNLLHKEPLMTFGAGSERAAKATEALFYKSGFVPGLRSLFSHITRGVADPQRQKAMDTAFASLQNIKGAMADYAPAADDAYRYLGGLYDDLAKHADIAGDASGKMSFTEAAAYIGETQSKIRQGGHLTQAEIRKLFSTEGASAGTIAKADEFARGFSSLLDDSITELKNVRYDLYKRLGGRGEDLLDRYVAHMPRRPTDPRAAQVHDEILQRMLQTDFWGALPRVFKHLPEGRTTVNRLAADPLVGRPLERAPSKWAKFFKGPAQTGQIRVGQVVHAADRDNFGRVLGLHGDEALVHFINPQTGAQARVPLATKLLTPSAGAPKNVPIPEAFLARSQQIGGMRAWLEQAGVEVADDIKEAALRSEYIFHRWLKPAAIRSGVDGDELARLQSGGWAHKVMDTDAGRTLELVPDEKAPAVAKVMADYFGQHTTRAEGLFTRTMVEDFLDYMTHLETSISNLHTIHNFLGGVVRTGAQLEKAKGGFSGYRRLDDVWQGVKTTKDRPALHNRGMHTLAEDVAQKQGIPLEGEEAVANLIGDLYVPEATAKALQGQVNLMNPRSAESSTLGQAIKSFTALFKAGATIPYISFHLRNRVDGVTAALLAESNYRAADILEFTIKAHKWRKGVRGTDFDGYLEHAMRHNLFGTMRDIDILGVAAEGTEAIPKGGLDWALKPLMEPAKHSLKPWAMRGVKSDWLPGDPQFFIGEAGDRVFKLTEFMNRIVPFAAAMKRGMTGAQAKRFVDIIQYNYRQAIGTPFERQALRYVFPFYGWLKSNTMYQVGNIANYPGGRNATAIRMALALQRESGGYTPKFLREAGGFPWPWQEGGKDETTYVSRFGLRFEDLQNLNLGDPRRMTERYIAQTNPLISGPYSWLTQRDPYFGREVKHLRTPLADVAEELTGVDVPRSPGAEYFGKKFTPFSRAGAEALKAKDVVDALLRPEEARKPVVPAVLDLLSGMKIGAYPEEQWRLRDLQQAQKELLERSPYVWEFSQQYVPKHLQDQAPPEVLDQLQLLRALEQAIRETKAKQAKKGGQ
jgi:hypothetical protein